jgi:hypothetical protein
VRLNPGGAVNSFVPMCEAIGSWHVSTFNNLYIILNLLDQDRLILIKQSLYTFVYVAGFVCDTGDSE